MKQTSYAGINYAGFTQTNRDPKTGIRFGVISQHSLMPEALNDFCQNGEDMAFKAHHEEVMAALESALNDCDKLKDSFRKEDLEQIVEAAKEAADDSIGNAYEGESDPLYRQDGYKIARCLETDLFILASPFFTFAQFCSPCVPGACNLDSPLDYQPEANKCFCLGHDWFEGPAPYPVYSVATGELVPVKA